VQRQLKILAEFTLTATLPVQFFKVVDQAGIRPASRIALDRTAVSRGVFSSIAE